MVHSWLLADGRTHTHSTHPVCTLIAHGKLHPNTISNALVFVCASHRCVSVWVNAWHTQSTCIRVLYVNQNQNIQNCTRPCGRCKCIIHDERQMKWEKCFTVVACCVRSMKYDTSHLNIFYIFVLIIDWMTLYLSIHYIAYTTSRMCVHFNFSHNRMSLVHQLWT